MSKLAQLTTAQQAIVDRGVNSPRWSFEKMQPDHERDFLAMQEKLARILEDCGRHGDNVVLYQVHKSSEEGAAVSDRDFTAGELRGLLLVLEDYIALWNEGRNSRRYNPDIITRSRVRERDKLKPPYRV